MLFLYNIGMRRIFITFLFFISLTKISAQEIELSNAWVAKKAAEVNVDGKTLTSPDYTAENWLPATVPGTVLTTLLNNQLVPDPFFGMNNQKINDISKTGREEYTYWFFNRFRMVELKDDQQVWLKFRGINYFADFYLNGQKLNLNLHEGMFLREKFLITDFIKGFITNRLAVFVEPPDPVGEPNGGQGGDGTLGKSVGMQFTTGWDWIQPVADRNTGIWDKVSIEITGPVDIRDPFIKTRVPGIRIPGELQEPAYVTVSVELVNATDTIQKGELLMQFLQLNKKQKVTLAPKSTTIVTLKEIKIDSPRLWWPNGTGSPSMYDAQLFFTLDNGTVSDNESLSFGIRETSTYFDKALGSRVFLVNGQKIFIKGGNWIASDALLRLSREKYDQEVKMHAQMNMNMIRVWGGSITERPEFYDACDKYGILVWQDLWITGDVNGSWSDQKKADSQAVRRDYPNDHSLFIKSVIDQVKMLRNHPSLYLWCGGNEFPPPDDINKVLRDSVFPKYDGTRYYLNQSASEDLLVNPGGKTTDNPNSMKEPSVYFTNKFSPFNPAIGSVGFPNITSLRKIMDESDLVPPWIEKNMNSGKEEVNSTWTYHKYLGYGDFIERYGEVKGIEDFSMKAQLNNYEQTRSLQEGFNAGMWKWYTGMLVWKSQNPWTALRGQFYDTFLDQNAGFYGYKHASQPLHIQLNLDDTTVCIVNTIPKDRKDLSVKAIIYDIHGKILSNNEISISVKANSVTDTLNLKLPGTGGPIYFIRLSLINMKTNSVLDENLYWISSAKGDYTNFNDLAEANVSVTVNRTSSFKLLAEIRNTGGETAFFMKGMIINKTTGNQVLPVYMDDNYITLFPGEKKIIEVDLYNINAEDASKLLVFEMDGWNLQNIFVNIPPEIPRLIAP
jgi:mannosylglycoprotein endo-beta-mannosidase